MTDESQNPEFTGPQEADGTQGPLAPKSHTFLGVSPGGDALIRSPRGREYSVSMPSLAVRELENRLAGQQEGSQRASVISLAELVAARQQGVNEAQRYTAANIVADTLALAQKLDPAFDGRPLEQKLSILDQVGTAVGSVLVQTEQARTLMAEQDLYQFLTAAASEYVTRRGLFGAAGISRAPDYIRHLLRGATQLALLRMASQMDPTLMQQARDNLIAMAEAHAEANEALPRAVLDTQMKQVELTAKAAEQRDTEKRLEIQRRKLRELDQTEVKRRQAEDGIELADEEGKNRTARSSEKWEARIELAAEALRRTTYGGVELLLGEAGVGRQLTDFFVDKDEGVLIKAVNYARSVASRVSAPVIVGSTAGVTGGLIAGVEIGVGLVSLLPAGVSAEISGLALWTPVVALSVSGLTLGAITARKVAEIVNNRLEKASAKSAPKADTGKEKD